MYKLWALSKYFINSFNKAVEDNDLDKQCLLEKQNKYAFILFNQLNFAKKNKEVYGVYDDYS